MGPDPGGDRGRGRVGPGPGRGRGRVGPGRRPSRRRGRRRPRRRGRRSRRPSRVKSGHDGERGSVSVGVRGTWHQKTDGGDQGGMGPGHPYPPPENGNEKPRLWSGPGARVTPGRVDGHREPGPSLSPLVQSGRSPSLPLYHPNPHTTLHASLPPTSLQGWGSSSSPTRGLSVTHTPVVGLGAGGRRGVESRSEAALELPPELPRSDDAPLLPGPSEPGGAQEGQ